MTEIDTTYDDLLAFLYRAPVALIEITTNGDISMLTPRAAALLISFANNSNLDNLFHIFDSLDPQIRCLCTNFPGTVGVVCEALIVPIRPSSAIFNDMVLEVSIFKTDAAKLTVMINNITERHQVDEERALRKAIVDSSEDAITSIDLNGKILTWNDSAERMFGYNSKEMIGKPITLLIPGDRHEAELKIISRINSAERIKNLNTVRVAKNCQLIDVSVTISPIVVEGQVIGASIIDRDITEVTIQHSVLSH